MRARANRRRALVLFGHELRLSGVLASDATVLGLELPVAGIAVVAALTLVALTIWVIVFSRAPRHITQPITHQYAIADETFVRSTGVLLGPALLPGNRIDTLVNAD